MERKGSYDMCDHSLLHLLATIKADRKLTRAFTEELNQCDVSEVIASGLMQ